MQPFPNEAKICHIKAQIDMEGLDSCMAQVVESLQEKEKEDKNNFSIVRERFTYLVYPKRGFINVCKIGNLEEYSTVMHTFAKSFKVDERELSASRIKIDNITASGSFQRKVNLNELNSYFNRNPLLLPFPKTVYHYNRNRFPAAFIKTRQGGTVAIHSSGKFFIVGTKNTKQIDTVYKWICAIISKQ
jgi:TATA-box binding protein (TBP) (component of TFIID and TFIIIB)